MCKRIYKEQTTEAGGVPFFKIGTFGGEPDAFISQEVFEEYRKLYPFPKIGDILITKTQISYGSLIPTSSIMASSCNI